MTAKGDVPKEKLQDFHAELEQLLRRQLERKPELDDVRLKLLELYFEQRRQEDFLRAARACHRRIEKPAASRMWQRVASMGRMLLPNEGLFSGHGSDVVEFIDERPPAKKAAPRTLRFGDDERYRPLFDALAREYEPIRRDPRFLVELDLQLVSLATRRPTPFTHARQLSDHLGGAQIYVKREDLAGEHPHLTVAVTGQALLARRLGRRVLVTGTADGRRGVAASAVAARLGLKALVFTDPEKCQRYAANLLFIRLLGAELRPVKVSHYRNRDVREAALEHWSTNPEEAFLLTGLDAAPPPFPVMTQEFTASVGRECRRQLSSQIKKAPDLVVTRGSQSADALGLLPAFLGERSTRLVCVEPEGAPETAAGRAADPFTQIGMPMTTSERTAAKKVLDRLEYPSVAREHALFKASGRVEYVQGSRAAARQALVDFARFEGVIAPVETAHALAWACDAARRLPKSATVVVLMSESAGKDPWDIDELIGGR